MEAFWVDVRKKQRERKERKNQKEEKRKDQNGWIKKSGYKRIDKKTK